MPFVVIKLLRHTLFELYKENKSFQYCGRIVFSICPREASKYKLIRVWQESSHLATNHIDSRHLL